MIRKLTLATALAAAIALPAIAEDAKGPAIATPAAATNAAPAQKAGALPLTSLEAQAWIGKPVYSSDGQKLGEVVYIQRDDDNKVTWMNADVGGFLGVGKHQIKLTSAQFNLQTDRVVLDLTAAQVKVHPKTM